MFYLDGKMLGVGLCAANLGLRCVEAARTAHLVCRHAVRCPPQDEGLQRPMNDSPPS